MWFCGSTGTDIRGPWWVGDTSVTTPCQYGERASFITWPSAEVGNVIQRPASVNSASITSAKTVSQTITPRASASSATSPPFAIVNATQVASSIDRASVTVTNQPSDSSESGDRQTLALELGLGVPLGIACLSFLAFLLWKIRQRKKNSIQDEKFAQARKPEREVNHNNPPREISGGEAGQEMWAESPRQFTEIDSRSNYELDTH